MDNEDRWAIVWDKLAWSLKREIKPQQYVNLKWFDGWVLWETVNLNYECNYNARVMVLTLKWKILSYRIIKPSHGRLQRFVYFSRATNSNVGLRHLGVELGKTCKDMDCFAADFEDFGINFFLLHSLFYFYVAYFFYRLGLTM